jgi:hypothetical protein
MTLPKRFHAWFFFELATFLSGCALVLSGCGTEDARACTSDDDCKFDRVCRTGECTASESQERADAGGGDSAMEVDVERSDVGDEEDVVEDATHDIEVGWPPPLDVSAEDASLDCPQVTLRARLFDNPDWSTTNLVVPPPVGRISVDTGDVELPQESFEVQWSIIEHPHPSEPFFYNPASPFTQMVMTYIGIYRIELRVNDRREASMCQYEPQTMQIEMKPAGRVHIELFWDTPGDTDPTAAPFTDLDLRFANRHSTFDDLFTLTAANSDPDWGVRGASFDDPVLLHDGTDGNEPESITWESPSGRDCQCGLLVEYLDSEDMGPVYASLRYYIDGELYYEQLDKEMTVGQFWYVSELRQLDPRFSFDAMDQISDELPARDFP